MKCAVKKGKLGNAEQMLWQIRQMIATFNHLYANTDTSFLTLHTFAEDTANKLMAYNYGLQFANDVNAIIMHECEGYGAERQKRLFDEWSDIYPSLKKMAFNESKDDPELVYFWHQLDTRVKAAFGDYFEPKEVRYHAKLTYDDQIIKIMDYTDISTLFCLDTKEVLNR